MKRRYTYERKKSNNVAGAATGALPIWHKPAWITSMVGLVTALLTIPEKWAEVEVKKEETAQLREETAQITEETSRQRKERILGLVERALSAQGDDRLFWLRYVAATFDNENLDKDDVRNWADSEVQLEDRLIELRAQYEARGEEIKRLESTQGSRLEDIQSLRQENENIKVELETLKAKSPTNSSPKANLNNMVRKFKIDIFSCQGESKNEDTRDKIAEFLDEPHSKSTSIRSRIGIIEKEILTRRGAAKIGAVGGKQIRFDPFSDEEALFARVLRAELNEAGFGIFEPLSVGTPTPNYLSIFVCDTR